MSASVATFGVSEQMDEITWQPTNRPRARALFRALWAAVAAVLVVIPLVGPGLLPLTNFTGWISNDEFTSRYEWTNRPLVEERVTEPP
ncbi:MAG: hypothetical protein AAFR01_03940, partial [Pseudomonadota bacterium]